MDIIPDTAPMFSLPDDKTHLAFSKPESEKAWRDRPTKAEGNMREAVKEQKLSEKEYDLFARYALLRDLIELGQENIYVYPYHLSDAVEAYKEFELVHAKVVQNQNVVKALNTYKAWLKDPANQELIDPTVAKDRIKNLLSTMLNNNPEIKKRIGEIANALAEKTDGKSAFAITGKERDNLKLEAKKLKIKALSEYKHVDWVGETKWGEVIRILTDKMVYVGKYIKALEQQLGFKLPPHLSAYIQESLVFSKVQDANLLFDEQYFEPLVDSMAENGVSFDDLSWYAYAIHAPERNAELQRRDKKEVHGSGLSDTQAQKILSRKQDARFVLMPNVKSTKKALEAMEKPYQLFRNMIEGSKTLLMESGLYDEANIEHWPNWEFYAPLQGVSAKDHSSGSKGGGKGGTRGKEIQHAKGRSSEPANVVIMAYKNAGELISRKHMNEIFKAFGDMALAYPNPEIYRIHKGKVSQRIANSKSKMIIAYKGDKGKQMHIEFVGEKGALLAEALNDAGRKRLIVLSLG